MSTYTRPVRYMGVIQSKRKVAGLFGALKSEDLSLEELDRVYAPIGIDIGAAFHRKKLQYIVAELTACRRRATAVLPHLRYRTDLSVALKCES